MLTATSLTRRFGDRLAVDDVSFEVGRGEIFALLGPNGAGKTTTMRMLAGLVAPTSGHVSIDGTDITSRSAGGARGRIGLLTETPGLWDRLSVGDNLLTYAKLHGLPNPARAVTEALTLVDLNGRVTDLAAHLSKGMRQRVALARALIHKPAVVLLDEPTSGLDPQSAREVRAMIVRLRDEGRAVLLSTHNLDEVERVADRVAILRARLIAVDSPDGLRARVFGRRVRIELRGSADAHIERLRALGLDDVQVAGSGLSIRLPHRGPDDDRTLDTPAIVRRLVESGAAIESVMPEEPTLEDVYVRLIDQAPGRPA